MSQVASETPISGHSLSPARASAARSGPTSAGGSPFDSLIGDSAPPPASDQGSPPQATSQDTAAQPPAETAPSQPHHDGKTSQPTGQKAADNGKIQDKGGSDQRTKAKTDTKATEATKTGSQATTEKATKLDPLQAGVLQKKTGKSDKADTDKTDKSDKTHKHGKTDAAAKSASAGTPPAAPGPTAAPNVATKTHATAQGQAPAKAATAPTAAVAVQRPTSPIQSGGDTDKASPTAKAPASIANVVDPAARHAAQAERSAQTTPQAKASTPDPAPHAADASGKPAPAFNGNQQATEQKSTAGGKTPANAHRMTPPNPANKAATNTQTAQAPSAGNATPNLGLPTPAGQPTTQTSAATTPASPGPQAPPAAPVPLPGLAVAIAARASAGRNSFSIRLDPPELGRVDVRLSVDKDGHISSHLVADRKDTLALLQRDASGLQRALQDAGFKTTDNGLQFSLRDSFAGLQQQQQQQQQQSNGTPVGHIVLNNEMPATGSIPSGYGRYLGRAGGVDIRV